MGIALKVAFLSLTILWSSAILAQGNPYTFVKMSLMVPWTLYFVFLGGVLIPFVAMIYLAWRQPPDDQQSNEEK